MQKSEVTQLVKCIIPRKYETRVTCEICLFFLAIKISDTLHTSYMFHITVPVDLKWTNENRCRAN